MPRVRSRNRSNEPSRYRRVGIFFIGVLVVFLLLLITPARGIFSGIQSSLYTVALFSSKAWSAIQTPEEGTEAALALCEEQYYSLATDIAKTGVLEKQVQELKDALAYTSNVEQQAITARILASSLGEQEIVIDQGESDGILGGGAVIVEGGHLIGVVKTVEARTSRIELLSSETSSITASKSTSTETIGIMEGTGGFLLNLNFVPQTVSLKEGELLITSKEEKGIPQGLVLGRIETITKNETALFQEASIAPIVNAADYSFVLVLPPEADSV